MLWRDVYINDITMVDVWKGSTVVKAPPMMGPRNSLGRETDKSKENTKRML